MARRHADVYYMRMSLYSGDIQIYTGIHPQNGSILGPTDNTPDNTPDPGPFWVISGVDLELVWLVGLERVKMTGTEGTIRGVHAHLYTCTVCYTPV